MQVQFSEETKYIVYQNPEKTVTSHVKLESADDLGTMNNLRKLVRVVFTILRNFSGRERINFYLSFNFIICIQ